MASQGFVISNNTELPDRLRYTKEVSVFYTKHLQLTVQIYK